MIVRRLPDTELYHHGILGQKWGVRRYQNKDGTLTAAGRKKKGLIQTVKDKKKMKKLRDAKEKKKQEKAEREEVINSGDYRQVKKIQNKLTDEEYVRALQRISYNEKLKEYENGRKSVMLQKGINALTTTATLAKTIADVSSSANTVKKSLEDMGVIEKKKSALEKVEGINKLKNANLETQILNRKAGILTSGKDQEAIDSILGIKRPSKQKKKDDDD